MKKGLSLVFLCMILMFSHLRTSEPVDVEARPHSIVKVDDNNWNSSSEEESKLSQEDMGRIRESYDLDPPAPPKQQFIGDFGIRWGSFVIGSGNPEIRFGPGSALDVVHLVMLIMTLAFM